MINPIKLSDFSLGWIPNIDPISGPKNGLLKMDSLELDKTGAIQLAGGTKNIIATNYAANAHTLYSKFISGVQHRYVATTDGIVYRDTNSLGSGWSTTRVAFMSAFEYVFIFGDTKRRKDNGTITDTIGIPQPTAPTVTAGVAGGLTGTYEFAQQNVYNHGNGYFAKSALSPVTTPVTFINQVARITPFSLSSATEAWIFRRGETLDQFYRIAVVTSTAAFNNDTSDTDALAENVTASEFLQSTDSVGLPEAILAACGLIRGRAVLVGGANIYITDANSPDSYDVRYVIPYGSNQLTGSELFLWARKVGENNVVIATTNDLYVLTGTFTELADGYLDVYLRPLGVENPPISIDVAPYGNQLISMAADGWRIYDISGNSQCLTTSTFTSRLYRGETIEGYGGVPIYLFPNTDVSGTQLRYSCAVARNKLWVRIPTITSNDPSLAFDYRVEVFDFERKYWRPEPIKPLLLWAQEDDAIMGFFNDTQRNLRELDNQFVKTNNGNLKTINFKTPWYEFDRQRGDLGTFKLIINTGNSTLAFTYFYTDDYNTINSGTTNITTNGLQEVVIPLAAVTKAFYITITGAANDFQISEFLVYFDPYPQQITYYHLKNFDFGIAQSNKKKIANWPIIINTLGQNINMTPVVDGVDGTSVVINSAYFKSVYYYFQDDVFLTDLGLKLNNTAQNHPFELLKILPPTLLQVLPEGKEIDQIGPIDLFRYGKIKKLRFRIYSNIDATIAYKIYFDDINQLSENLSITAGDKVYEIDIPKTTAGTILRITLGPSAAPFHRFDCAIQVAKEGKDTDIEWIDYAENTD